MSDKVMPNDLEKAALMAAIDVLASLDATYLGTRDEIMNDLGLTESAFATLQARLKAMYEGKELPPPAPQLVLPKWEIQQYELIAMRYCVEAIDAVSAVDEFLKGNVLRECGMVSDVVDIVEKYGMKVSEDFTEELERRGVDVAHDFGERYLPSIRSVEPWSHDPEEDKEEKEFVPEDGEEEKPDPQTFTRVKVCYTVEWSKDGMVDTEHWRYLVYAREQIVASGGLGVNLNHADAIAWTCRDLQRNHGLRLKVEQFHCATEQESGGACWEANLERPKEVGYAT